MFPERAYLKQHFFIGQRLEMSDEIIQKENRRKNISKRIHKIH